jgi:Tol biopolymer transport system component
LTRKADGKTQEYEYRGWAEFGPGGEGVFTVFTQDGRWMIAVQRFGEPQPRIVSDGPLDAFPSINPDGRTFIYNGNGGHDLYLCSLDAASSRECRILHTDPLGPMHPRLSPNGRLLAYEVSDAAGPRVRIVTLDGKQLRDMSVRSAGPVLWTSDTTVWTCESEARMWTEIDAAAGRPTGRRILRPEAATVCEPPPGLADLANFEVRRRSDVTTEVRLVRGM